MDYGQSIAEGTPDEIRSNPEVISAYLGGQQLMLRAEDLHVYYGGIHALKGVSLKIGRGR